MIKLFDARIASGTMLRAYWPDNLSINSNQLNQMQPKNDKRSQFASMHTKKDLPCMLHTAGTNFQPTVKGDLILSLVKVPISTNSKDESY